MKKYIIYIFVLFFVVACQGGGQEDVEKAFLEQYKDQEGPLLVDYHSPTGDVSVSQNKIVIHFNQPMVPLMSLGEVKLSHLVTITPKVEGYFKWVNSKTLVYQVKGNLPYATKFDVKVHSGKESLLGYAMLKEFVFSFQTARPKITNTHPPKNATGLERSPTIKVFFNQPIAYHQFQEKTELLYGAEQTKTSFTTGCYVNGKEQKDTASCTEFYVTPQNKLPKDTAVKLKIAKGLRGIEGPETSLQDQEFQFHTHGDFVLRQLECADQCLPDATLRFYASTPIDKKEFHKHVFFDPPVKNLEKKYKYWSRDKGYLSVYVGLLPNKEYKVTVDSGLKDKFGQELGSKKTFTIQTAHRKPAIHVPFVSYQVLRYHDDLDVGFMTTNVKTAQAHFKFFPKDTDVIDFVEMASGMLTKFEKDSSKWNVTKTFSGHVTDRKKYHKIPIGDLLGQKQSAIFLSDYQSPEVAHYNYNTKEYDISHNWLLKQVTDLGIDLKHAAKEGLIWITSLSSAEPVSQVQIAVYNSNGNLLYRTKTNATGFAKIPGRTELLSLSKRFVKEKRYDDHFPLYIFAQKGGDRAFVSSQWSDDLGYWYYDDYYDYNHSKTATETETKIEEKSQPQELRTVRGHILTDRGLYKPGETIHIKGFLRDVTTTGLKPFGEPVFVVIEPPRAKDPIKIRVVPNARGNFTVSHQLEEHASLGSYSVKVNSVGQWAQINSYASFQVQQFRKPEFKVSIDTGQKEYFKGEPVDFLIQANYLFGAPMEEAPFGAYTSKQYTTFYPDVVDESLSFGRLYEHRRKDQDRLFETSQQKEGMLDTHGKTTVSLSSDKDSIDPLQYNFDVEVTGLSKQKQAAFDTVIVHPASFYIGGKVEKLFQQTKDPIKIQFTTVIPSGKLVMSKDVTVDMMQVQWVSVKREGLNSQYETETKRVEKRIAGCVKKMQNKSEACEFMANEPGYYFFKLTSKDEKGRLVITEVPFYVTGSAYSHWQVKDGFELELVKDKKEYGVGDVAKVLVKSPYARAQALVSLERDHILSYHTQELKGNSTLLEIPIKEFHAPNVFLSVVLLKGATDIDESYDKASLAKTLQQTQALVKAGQIEIVVKPHNKNLTLEVNADRKVYKPGEKVTVNFDLKDFQSKDKAEVTVMVVDEGVLLAGGYQLENPLHTLYKRYVHKMVQLDSRTRFVRTQGLGEKIEDPASGGGRMSGFRQKFIPLAYFNGDIETDEAGNASVSFQLPDQLTTFKVMAIANAHSDQFGLAETSFQTQKDVMIRPSLPRFIRVGDSFESDVAVHNNTNSSLTAKIQVESNFLKIVKGESGNVTIPPKSSVVYPVSIKVDDAIKEHLEEESVTDQIIKSAKADVSFEAVSGETTDRVKITLPVVQSKTVETVATSGVSTGVVTEFLEKTDLVEEDSGSLTVDLSTGLASRLEDKVKILQDYPYECLEQRMSKLYPMLLFPEKDDFFSGAERNSSIRFDRIKTFLKKLKTEQGYQGDFSFWPWGYASPSLTLMVAEFLIDAKEAGHDVEGMLGKIKNKILKVYLNDKSYELRDYGHAYRDRLKVNALYVLHLMKQAQPSYYAAYQNKLHELDIMSQLRLVEMIHATNNNDTFIKTWLGTVKNKIRIKGEEAYVDFKSDTNSFYYFGYSTKILTAHFLKTLIHVDPSHPMLFPLLFGMLQEKAKSYYVSSLEAVAVLKTLKSYQDRIQSSDEPVFARLMMNDKDLLLARLDSKEPDEQLTVPVSKLPKKLTLKLVKDTGDLFFYDIKYHTVLKQYRSYGLEQGITLTREYYTVNDKKVDVKELKHGQTYKVILNFFFADNTDYFVVEEPLAAGLEPINFALSTTRRSLRGQHQPKQPTLNWYLTHREFQDRKIILFADYIPRGFYEFVYYVNVTNRGQYLVPPAKAMEMYEPDIFGTTASEKIIIH